MLTGQSIGVYRIHTLLGVGGMGEVYRAQDTKLKREVALKILPRAVMVDPDRLTRFEQEARILATLNHPNIAAIYGVEESDGLHALVLELVEGDTLAEKLTTGAVRVADALALARQVSRAVGRRTPSVRLVRSHREANQHGWSPGREPAASGDVTGWSPARAASSR